MPFLAPLIAPIGGFFMETLPAWAGNTLNWLGSEQGLGTLGLGYQAVRGNEQRLLGEEALAQQQRQGAASLAESQRQFEEQQKLYLGQQRREYERSLVGMLGSSYSPGVATGTATSESTKLLEDLLSGKGTSSYLK